MTAKELYDIIQELAGSEPSVQNLRQLHELIALTAAEGSRTQGGTFGNLFSQVDFVCQYLGLKASQKRAIQTARRHANGDATLTHGEWLYDLRAVTMLVGAVFHEDVPGALLQVLPVNLAPTEKGLVINRRYVRCIVRSFNETTIKADTADGEILIDYANTEGGRDFAYIKKVLREGMQLNLLDCHKEDGRQSAADKGQPMITPGVIVVEPDFMLDISALAACFTAYGHHPLLYTVGRLKPRPNTQAVLLGNFAGTALDDIIHNPEVTLQQSLQRSYREQAERFAACEDFDQEKFEAEAAVQMQNIREAVKILKHSLGRRTLATEGTQETSDLQSQALLEPSFVCEKLGLQGRVDLMTADMHLLVEQKSGKNAKIDYQSHDAHGMQLESHYVQLLLYYGILRYNFEKSDAQVDTRLLYSRYTPDKGLVAVNYYRTLFREAIKLRNQIVATELLIARDGFGRIIPLLNADITYQGVTRDAFFHHYVLSKIENLQSQFSNLKPLERAYYERMMTFVYREQRAQKLGSSEQTLHHAGGCNSDLWLMPLSEKLEQGNIILSLSIEKREKTDPDGGYDLITLHRQSSQTTLNFRVGDMVYLYQYDEAPDVRQQILYKGTLSEMDGERVVVALNDGQQNESVFAPSKHLWAIEHGGSDVGTNSNIRSLHQFILSSQRKKDLLLGQRAPETDTSLTLLHPYNPHYDDIILRVKQARDYFLLVGPPGTGKTSMALRFIVEEELGSQSSDSSILLMAYTNRAVDEIRSMLQEAGLENDERIMVGTTSMMQARPFLLAGRHFSLAVVDEASQVLEPGLIGLLSHATIERFVLIGDHKQLPAVVQQNPEDARVDDPLLMEIGLTDCRQSLFQRLYNWEVAQGRKAFIGTLNHQGRMHPEVAQFACEHFYGSWLTAVPVAHQQETAIGYDLPAEDALDTVLKQQRTAFFEGDTDEVIALAKHIRRFYGKRFDAERTLGIIVTYRRQIAAIRAAVPDVTIDTVERYQGSQRDVIIYAVGVNRHYQMDFLTASTFVDEEGLVVDRKLNVALTRARRQMLMVGHAHILNENTLFRQFIERFSAKM